MVDKQRDTVDSLLDEQRRNGVCRKILREGAVAGRRTIHTECLRMYIKGHNDLFAFVVAERDHRALLAAERQFNYRCITETRSLVTLQRQRFG